MIYPMKTCLKTNSPEETVKVADSIGRRLKGGEIFVLISDLGGGKTTFTRGLASAIGSHDEVSSPSFTLSHLYKGGDLTIHHYDFYRLPDIGLMREELEEVLEEEQSVVVIEWPKEVETSLPANRMIKVHISRQKESEDVRNMCFEVSDSLEDIIEHIAEAVRC